MGCIRPSPLCGLLPPLLPVLSATNGFKARFVSLLSPQGIPAVLYLLLYLQVFWDLFGRSCVAFIWFPLVSSSRGSLVYLLHSYNLACAAALPSFCLISVDEKGFNLRRSYSYRLWLYLPESWYHFQTLADLCVALCIHLAHGCGKDSCGCERSRFGAALYRCPLRSVVCHWRKQRWLLPHLCGYAGEGDFSDTSTQRVVCADFALVYPDCPHVALQVGISAHL